jgi:NAD(P)-dependent dehydrogenase (short-subunit alcohol dehydrogenase family)
MKRIIITGANEGIGYYLVCQALADGQRVAVLDIQTENLTALQQTYPQALLVFTADVRDAERVSACVAQAAAAWGGLDYAIHNAALCLFTDLEHTPNIDFERVHAVNLYGALNLTRAVLPILRAQGAGRVFFTSSGVGVTGFANISAYASSKGALEALAKCLAIENQIYGVSFHLLHPPLTRTASAKPLPVPPEMMADPETVGRGLARRLGKGHFVISHSFGQQVQTQMAYLFPLALGRLMSKMTSRYQSQ